MTGLTPTQEQPMTQERLDEIEAREAKATEGPWGVDGPAQCGPGDSLAVYHVEDGGTVAYVQPSWDDAEFIAHARTDIPALLAEVERLRALITVDDAMVERGARAYYDRSVKGLDESLYMQWDQLARARPGGAQRYRDLVRTVLEAVLNPGEGS